MLLINDPSDAPAGPKVVAVGSFDGLHLGHQHLIHLAQQEAKNKHVPLLIYTFDPPSKVFMKGEGFLTDLTEKLELLRGLGVEIALIVPFTEAFSKRSKDDFLGDLRTLEAQRIYVGADFRFGQGRAGTLEDLNKVAPTEILPLLELRGGPVKSSRIRDLLREGEVDEAKLLLGRAYSARGIVQEGDKLGRRLGFPTANIEVAPLKILPRGVFAVRVLTQQGRFGGMANVGYRPTVSGQTLRLEVHLFGFTGDLYGQELSVEFLTKLRGEQKFESLEALQAQLTQDAEAARRVLGI
ncbi:MAG: riboflavin biosynthesis protein RibF [Meiothermus sp.]|uniref:riboflavin biosynthesis protein RibF n=1 Tax=Meiothermus sp. TaxID=1955249 RepID=UPI0025E7FBED|nr:riboflavin biosynthesis protein RibF [Meiothermus sp.]MCS7069622.1 riboflavin biosynthesis protein RibF [Meiothermus sp.]MCX7600965.1 riboflavin biosynthesis protein RibF [Meiothermus sp.]